MEQGGIEELRERKKERNMLEGGGNELTIPLAIW